MLRALQIRNYAIIDQVELSFSPHLNIITGETGAGKSILIGALSLILGDRADSAVLRDRSQKCLVEGEFLIAPAHPLTDWLRTHDLLDEDELPDSQPAPQDRFSLIVRREISAAGKSRAFINDRPVTLDLLREASSLMVDLHRQFDALSLADAGFQRGVLDALAGNATRLATYRQAYLSWKELSAKLDILRGERDKFLQEQDYFRFQYEEIREADFAPQELESAEAELKLLSHAGTIRQTLEALSADMDEGEQPLLSRLRQVRQQLQHLSDYHPGIAALAERTQAVQVELTDIAAEISRLADSISTDRAREEWLNERISRGYRLLKKHGLRTTDELIRLGEELGAKLQGALDTAQAIARLEKQQLESEARVRSLAAALTKTRSAQISSFQKKVDKLLHQVGMPHAQLRVQMTPTEPGEYGADQVVFQFDANRSGKFEPLRRVASGGELSRLMLSVKSLVAASMDMPTLIFDEIDSGISGEAARQVGRIMRELSESRQILAITHQPQIAGRAHRHLLVYKDFSSGAARTRIRALEGEERVEAIARMLGGEHPTAAAMQSAREMVGL